VDGLGFAQGEGDRDVSPLHMFHCYKAIVTLSAPRSVQGRTVFTTARVVLPGISDQSNRTSSIE
jgi:hypothetical protein